jgi:hypothetical protein
VITTIGACIPVQPSTNEAPVCRQDDDQVAEREFRRTADCGKKPPHAAIPNKNRTDMAAIVAAAKLLERCVGSWLFCAMKPRHKLFGQK